MAALNLLKDLEEIRGQFPILSRCVYLISNSLGAVPMPVADDLLAFYRLWAEKGVRAWEEEWWESARKLGNNLASFLGAGEDEIAMMPNATIAHWVALSTQFSSKKGKRKKIVMTDHDFPSSIYAVNEIAKAMGWTVEMVRSEGRCGIDTQRIVERIDEATLFVATSHVYFKSGFVQRIVPIVKKAKKKGVLTLFDGYHAPGTIPVDLSSSGVDFYVGGCLKWLCGGPGNAFLYVSKNLSETVRPKLTGWFAHRSPFSFSESMDWSHGAQRFMSGTPSISSLYTASAGLNIIKKVGIKAIRRKSLVQTQRIIDLAKQRGFPLFSPEDDESRGGAVSIVLPHGYQVKQALGRHGIVVDFRKGKDLEPDMIRIGPHFYSTNDEIDRLFSAIDEIDSTGEYREFPAEKKIVT